MRFERLGGAFGCEPPIGPSFENREDGGTRPPPRIWISCGRVAALLVLLDALYGETPTSLPTAYLGLFGVLLSFVHTVLVLMYFMERTCLHGRNLLQDFYIRRIFRIYPLSILAVAAAVVLHLDSNIDGINGLSHGPLPGTKAILSQFLLVQNLLHVTSMVNVLWSLPFELQIYIFLLFCLPGFSASACCGRCWRSGRRLWLGP